MVFQKKKKRSLAQELARAETEVVRETRNYLTDNGVSLDYFSQVSVANFP